MCTVENDPISESPPEEISGRISEQPIYAPNIDEGREEFQRVYLTLFNRRLQNQIKHDLFFASKNKTDNCLIAYRESIQKRYGCTVPFGLFLGCFGILVSIVTSSGNTIISISKEILEGIFIGMSVFSLGWTVLSLFRYAVSPKLSKEDVIAQMAFLDQELP